MSQLAALMNGNALNHNAPFESGYGLAAKDATGALLAVLNRTLGAKTTAVNMADAAHALVLGVAAAAQTRLDGVVFLVDAQSTGTSEILTYGSTEAAMEDLFNILVNVGGEGVVINNDGGTRVGYLAPGGAAMVHCDGTSLRVYNLTSDGEVLITTGTIPTAQVAAMNATPQQMVPAPGAGRFLQPEWVHWFLDFNSAAYNAAASGDTLVARYTNGSGAILTDAVAGDAIGAASADYHTIVSRVPEVIPVANAAIVAHITTGEWGTGDSPLKYEIGYRIRTLDFI